MSASSCKFESCPGHQTEDESLPFFFVPFSHPLEPHASPPYTEARDIEVREVSDQSENPVGQ